MMILVYTWANINSPRREVGIRRYLGIAETGRQTLCHKREKKRKRNETKHDMVVSGTSGVSRKKYISTTLISSYLARPGSIHNDSVVVFKTQMLASFSLYFYTSYLCLRNEISAAPQATFLFQLINGAALGS